MTQQQRIEPKELIETARAMAGSLIQKWKDAEYSFEHDCKSSLECYSVCPVECGQPEERCEHRCMVRRAKHTMEANFNSLFDKLSEVSYAFGTDFDNLCVEVGLARTRQDKKHGGSEHDDTHDYQFWTGIVRDLLRDSYVSDELHYEGLNPDAFREGMIEIAATSMAAIEYRDRRARRGLDRQAVRPDMTKGQFQDLLVRLISLKECAEVETDVFNRLYGSEHPSELFAWCEDNDITWAESPDTGTGIRKITFKWPDEEGHEI